MSAGDWICEECGGPTLGNVRLCFQCWLRKPRCLCCTDEENDPIDDPRSNDDGWHTGRAGAVSAPGAYRR